MATLVVPALAFVMACGSTFDPVDPGEDAQSPAGSVSAPEVTMSRTIEIDLSDVTGATLTRFSENTTALGGLEWAPFEPRVTWTLSEGDGLKSVYGELGNDGGETLWVSIEVRLAEQPPRGSFSMNRGSELTGSPVVTLHLEGIEGASSMRFTNDPDGRHEGDWEAFRERREWTLHDVDGRHVVRGQFMDELDRVLETSAAITLARGAPGGEILIDGGAKYTNDPDGLVTLDLRAVENAAEMRIANDETELASSPWSGVVSSKPWTLAPGEGPRVVLGEFRSINGLTNVLEAGIVVDRTPPGAPTVGVPARTGDRRPTFTFDADGASRYRVRQDAHTAWTEVSEPVYRPPEPLPTCNRMLELRVEAGDEAGNWSEATAGAAFVYCSVSGWVSEHDPAGGDLYIILLDEQQYGSDSLDFELDRAVVVPVGQPRFRFDDVPDGEWILLGFQDDDGNGELTMGLFGAPKEAWGTFAGESWARLVSFQDGHFVLSGDDWREVKLRFNGFRW